MRTQLLTLIILALLPRLSMAADSRADGIWVFEDTTASLSFEEVVAMPDAFVQTTDTNIGFSDSAFWIRVELTNDTDERQTQVVQFDSHVLPKIEAYEGNDIVASSGRSIAKTERPMPTILPSFPVELESDRSSIQYFKIASPYEISLSYEVKALNQAFTDSGQFETLRYALALGLFVLLVYNVATALIIRQTVHWLYVIFVGLMLSAQLLELNFFSLSNILYLMPFIALAGLACGVIFLALLLTQMSSKWFKWSVTGHCLIYTITIVVVDAPDAHQLTLEMFVPLALAILSAQMITGVVQQRPYSKWLSLDGLVS